MSPRFSYATNQLVAPGTPLRWDTDGTSGIPAAILDPTGAPIDQSARQPLTSSADGRIPTVFTATGVTLFVRALGFRGAVVSGVLATLTAADTYNPPAPSPGSGVDLQARSDAATALAQAMAKASPQDVTNALASLVGAAPEALNTIYELAATLMADESAAAALATLVSTKYTKPIGGIPSTDLASALVTLINGALQAADATGIYVPLARTVAGKPLTGNVSLVKGDVGLNLVDNTPDLQKPVSAAQQTAITQAINTAITNLVGTAPATLDQINELATAIGNDPQFVTTVMNAIGAKYTKPGTGIPSSDLATAVQNILTNSVQSSRKVAGRALTADIALSKTDVGLDQVANTAPAGLPISTATQAALDAKQTAGQAVTFPDGTVQSSAAASNLSSTAVAAFVTSAPTSSTPGLLNDQVVVMGTGDIWACTAIVSGNPVTFTWTLVGNVYSAPAIPSGKWTRPTSNGTSTATLSVNTLYAIPFRPRSDQLWSQFGLEVTAAAAAGGLLRLGMAPNLLGLPDLANAVDMGTKSSESTGRRFFFPNGVDGGTIALRGGPAPTRRSWAIVVCQGQACGLRVVASGFGETFQVDNLPGAANPGVTLQAGNVSGTIAQAVAAGISLTPSSVPFADLWMQSAGAAA